MADELSSFCEQFSAALGQNQFVRAVLGKYRGEDQLTRVDIREVQLKDGPMLSFTYHYKTRDIVKNYTRDAAVREIRALVGKDFLSSTLFSTEFDLFLEFSRKRVARLKRGRPTYRSGEDPAHNIPKDYLIDPHAKFLGVLGIAKAGQVAASWQDKFRQINKFVEIVDSLLPREISGNFNAIDFGSGKHYLTFSLYHYLRETRGLEARVTGIERREELVTFGRDAAILSGFSGLSFVTGEISSYHAETPDLVVALHACDTATDDAIVKGIKSGAKIILVAPCCHKFIRREIVVPDLLKPAFKHGILEENLSVALTDGLRAMILEAFGYQTKVFEFIEPEHTSKNIMIAATRKSANSTPDPQILSKFNAIKSEFGLKSIYLDQAIGLV